MHNTHERTIDASAETVGRLLEHLGQVDDRMWPSPAWRPMRLDRPVTVGADGGHGPIRYEVTEYEPGRRIRFAFHERTGITGYHEFVVEPVRFDARTDLRPAPDRCRVRHLLSCRPHAIMRVLLPLAIVDLHDALIEDLFDNIERITTGTVAAPAVWSRRVRLLRLLTEREPVRAVSLPLEARLVADLYESPDLQDSWQVPRRPGTTTDPQAWADRLFRRRSRSGDALFRFRNLVSGWIGVAPVHESEDPFRTVAATGNEVLLGSDADHLNFRASVLVEDRSVTVTSVAVTHNVRGRLYLSVVAIAHPFIVRTMLARAARSMTRSTTQRALEVVTD